MGFEIGKTVAGYEIVEVLDTSKTGVAYKVRNVFAQRFEVLKILPKSIRDDEEQNARFLREIKLHAQLLHPNIVTFYNAREIEGQLVMTKEFVPGVTVAERLQAGPIAWHDADRYACQALLALEYAHAHGIVHRGLSSSNLIVADEGIARLTGFGFAKSASDPELTAAGVVIGALKYMSPEQVKGDAVDARCDIYSLGIVLYEMLAGKLPFEAKSQFEIMLAHVNALPKHVSGANPAVPRELGDVVAKALAKSPDDRFQNAREFRDAIERIGLSHDAAATESKAPSLADAEVAQPVAEPAPLDETAPPASPATLPDAWTVESALELAESKLATMELKSTRPVAESSASVETPPPASSTALRDAWGIDTKPESSPAPATIETAVLCEAPVNVSPSLDWWTLDAALTLTEAKPATTEFERVPLMVEAAVLDQAPAVVSSTSLPDESKQTSIEPTPHSAELELASPVAVRSEPPLEPVEPVAEVAALNQDPAMVSPANLPDTQAIESALVSAESKPASTELTSEPDLPSPVAAIAEPPAMPQATLSDWWTLNSQPASAGSKTPQAKFALSPSEPEHSTPVVTTLAIADTPVVTSPSTPPDLWTSEWSPAPVESKPEFTQLELLSAALEPANPPVEEMSLAGTPAFPTPTPQPDLWATESTFTSVESRPAAAELSSSSVAPEAALLAATPAEPAETPLSLWTSGPPDTWASEPLAAPPSPKADAVDLQSLSAALEPPKAPVGPIALLEAPAAPPVLPQEAQVFESQPAATELGPQPAPENPPQAAAALASAPAPVAPKPVPVNPDLLTALFGDTLLSRLSLILVVCAITFFLGTVTLFAVLSVTKP